MEMPWPVDSADLSAIISDRTIRIVSNGDLDGEFYRYAQQFHAAARLLVRELLKRRDIRKLDRYFFSVTFLYRHSIELLLKAIGFQYLRNSMKRRNFITETQHNLFKLFDSIGRFVNHLIAESAANWLAAYFANIDEIDRESDSFRYPFGISTKKDWFGARYYEIKVIFEEQTHIDLVAHAHKMETAYALLNAAYAKGFKSSDEFKQYSPLFLEEPGRRSLVDSVIGYQFNFAEFEPYISAFTESAKTLYSLMGSGAGLAEYLFIPMCYLYRNAIELALKGILFEECSFGLQGSLKFMKKKKHSIIGFWNKIKKEIIEHSGEGDSNTIDVAERYITQLHNVDSTSDKFRYPTDKYLNLHFAKEEVFDIQNVNDFFNELASFLSAVKDMMSVHNEWKAEMEAEYGSYYGCYMEL